jgi:long-chain acyl-CoA synthetase
MSGAAMIGRRLDEWSTTPDADRAARVLAAAQSATGSRADAAVWQRYLEVTGNPAFLGALPDRAAREAWAETAFAAIAASGFSLETMLDWRARTRGDRVYLHDAGQPGEPAWTFAQVRQRVRRLGAHFLGPHPDAAAHPAAAGRPRVGILAPNGLQAAACDLACLVHDVLVVPLNVHEATESLAWICDRLRLTDLVIDGPDLLQRALDLRDRVAAPPRLHLLRPVSGAGDAVLIEAALADLGPGEVDRRLAARPRFDLREPCTVMFTSGSTGRPKGIAFSQFNIVSKRFARAAALPRVGADERLLCYLPLFHTFGRYLELLGMLYWGGTYVFAGNQSAETLMLQLPRVRPTGLISIPLRWQQIRDRAFEAAGEGGDVGAALREITGGRLNWGLSAAGYLEAGTFRFFQASGIELCSGFGMTEGTGGLTMTPPGEYVENSVGVPLPGVHVRFGDQGELLVAGPYVARYLPEEAPPGDLTVERPAADDVWIGTGDLFREQPGGHLQIVDRIKDIYKNNRGQTVAPRKVEARFEGVPGITRTFLAGDGRAFNALLIVPDTTDPVLARLCDQDRHDYFQRLITQANLDLAPYERVVNFALLDRDFSLEREELTPKGSYRRKQIATNFAAVIDELYRSDRRTLRWDDRAIVVPHWVLRDLGVLEQAVEATPDGLVDTRRGCFLRLAPGRAPGWLVIGDLEYRLAEPEAPVDLGHFARQPMLWLGNPALTAFLPCKDGWDHALDSVFDQVTLPDRQDAAATLVASPVSHDPRLQQLDDLCRRALFGPPDTALAALAEIEARLPQAPPHEARLLRRRLEALANHPLEAVRCRAYLILILDQPEPEYDRYLPAFLHSGKTFLSRESILDIARSRFESRRLQRFRQRLHLYRTRLDWPASPVVRQLFVDLLHLLADFARFQVEYYPTVRRELACWIVFDRDPELAAVALQLLLELGAWYDELQSSRVLTSPDWAGKLSFQEGLTTTEIARLTGVLTSTAFLPGSVALAFGETLDPAEIPAGGVWVSRTYALPQPSHYRVSINTTGGSHYDLLLILRDDLDDLEVMRTFYWVIALRAFPVGTPVVPRLGSLRPDLGVVSLAFANDLNVWERIRLHAATDASRPLERSGWRKLLVAGMATVLTAWLHSDRRILPGLITPSNVIVPDPDWRQDRLVVSLGGWKPYAGPLSLVRPLLKNFLRLPASHYPGCAPLLDDRWVLEAVAEALGPAAAHTFLTELSADLAREGLPEAGARFPEQVREFSAELAGAYRPPLALESAVERYREWRAANPGASPAASVDQIEALSRLYHLDDLGEPTRFALFAHTYFARGARDVDDAFARLQSRLFLDPQLRAAQTVELSDLQNLFTTAEDRLAFSRLAFPHAAPEHQPQVATVGDRDHRHVVLRTTLTDDHGLAYACLEPRSAAEVGKLYRLFLESGFPLTISPRDRHLIVLDAREQIIGGIVHRPDTGAEPHLEGVVVARTLRGRGLARALIDDFCHRMAAEGHTLVRTHFSLREFFQRQGFDVDRQWGGFVRRLR